MGFGFNLLAAFILIPGTIILLIVWVITRKKIFGIILGGIWAIVIGLVLFVTVLHLIFDTKEVTKEDVYGEYIIDRTKFAGRQADWQYEHYRFEITKQDSFLFHITDNERIIKTYRGTAYFLPAYKIARLVLSVDTPRNHIIENEPTLYRNRFSFYYVFKSPKFGNVFFTKDRYKKIN